MELSEHLIRYFFENISKNRANFNKITEQSDKIIVWLVGFSITIIALLLSKSELLIFKGNSVIVLILIYSFVIVFGILHRIFSYLVREFENKLISNFEAYISLSSIYSSQPNKTILQTKQTQEQEAQEIEKVIDVLKFHFNYSEKKLNRIRNKQETNKFMKRIFWPLNFITKLFFMLTILIFLSGIVYFIIKVIQIKICS